MTEELYYNGEALRFQNGIPREYSGFSLPNAVNRYAIAPWGMVYLQEIKSDHYLLRHFVFAVKQIVFLRTVEKNEGLQSIISLKGSLDYSVKGLPTITLREKEFHLFDAKDEAAIIGLKWGKCCSVLNTFYKPSIYKDLYCFFPAFKKHLAKAAFKPLHCLSAPKPARNSIHDSIRAIWLDRHGKAIERTYIEKLIEKSLVTLLDQAYSPSIAEKASERERTTADMARGIILQHINKHIPASEIAKELHCSSSWIQKAFSKVYGMGMRHYLREERMLLAKEWLLRGESVKVVAIELGMSPKHFPEEFKRFFGYTVTEMKRGRKEVCSLRVG